MGSRNMEEEDEHLVNIDHAGKIIEKVLENVNFDCGNLVCNSTSQRINTCQSSLEGDFKFFFFLQNGQCRLRRQNMSFDVAGRVHLRKN